MKINTLRSRAGVVAALILTSLAWGYVTIDNDGLPIKWYGSSVPIQIKVDNTATLSDGLTRAGSILAAMNNAQGGWNHTMNSLQLSPQIVAVGDGVDENDINEIFFSSTPYDQTWDANTLAVTTVWAAGDERTRADIIFNTAFTWDSYRGPSRATSQNGPWDIQRVALHELGHVLGLDHPDEAGQSVTAIMNSTASNVDSLQADDIAGAQSLYGAPGVFPGNDSFASAITINLGNNAAQVNGSNVAATKEAGEPNHADDTGGRSVWWKWTATGNGPVSLNAAGSNFDTLVGVYTGAAVSALTTIASNDDVPGSGNHTSAVTFDAINGTTYYIAVDGWGGDTGAVVLSLSFAPQAAPTITGQPANQTVFAGQTAQFTASANGNPGPTFQWQRLPAGSGTWSALSNGGGYAGASTATLTVSTTLPMNGDQFRCVATNAAGSATTTAGSLTVTATTAPAITSQPSSQTIFVGYAAAFNVAAAGVPSPTFQWRKNGVPLNDGGNISGATSSTLNISQAEISDSGSYTVFVSNLGGAVTSNPATLTVSALPGVVSAAAGFKFSLFVRSGGTLWAVGDNFYGKLGDGTTTAHPSPVLVAINVATCATGDNHGLFLKEDGALWAMGANYSGQLGDGTNTNRYYPVQLASGVVAAFAGGANNLFLKADGSLWVTGSNYRGQIGDGTTTDRLSPTQVASSVMTASASEHILYVKSDRTLWAVGFNRYGQLGDGTTTDKLSPVQVASEVVTVSAGGGHSLFIKSDGSLWSMGYNGYGQLGDGTTTNRANPIQIAAGVVAAYGGGHHSLFIKTDGSLWAVGGNYAGQLGTGDNTSRSIPVQISSGVVSASAGVESSLYLKTDGSLTIAGNNGGGWVPGTGGIINVPVPPMNATAMNDLLAHAIRLSWSPTIGATRYEVWRNTTNDSASASLISNSVPIALFYDLTANAGTNYYWIKAVNPAGASSFSAYVTYTVSTPPLITLQPVGQTVTSGSSVTFTAAASGLPAPTYQWWKNGASIAGATGSSYTIASVLLTDAGDYTVVATNAAGTATSNVAMLTVNPAQPPYFITQPVSRAVVTGDMVKFTVTAGGFPAPTYQWLKGGVVISGATGNAYTIASAAVGDTGSYTVVATNVGGAVTSNVATLKVYGPNTPYAFSTFAGFTAYGSADGTGSAAQFHNPQGVAVDGAGNVYVADTTNYTIRKITAAGVATTIAGSAGIGGVTNGTGGDARFWDPVGVAVDGAGNVYVTEAHTETIRKITPAGVVTTLAGDVQFGPAFADGTGSAARFSYPQGLAADSAGNVYVADYGNNAIRKITPAGVVTTLAGSPGSPGSADGTAGAAQFNYPYAVAVDGAGNVYVADYGNSAIRKITPGGVVTTLAGSAGSIGSNDGAGSTARFFNARGVAVDASGNVYVADTYNHTIRQITAAGLVTTLAGNAGLNGTVDGAGSAARFNQPYCVASDTAGNLFVTGFQDHSIRKVSAGGVVTTFAGQSATGSSDGVGGAARFNSPTGVAIDASGNAFVADTRNHVIRKITPAGTVSTFAGSPLLTGANDGQGSAARFNLPWAVAVDSAGNVYVADTGNFAIRKITPAGLVSTLANNIDGPYGVALDAAGNVYVAQYGNRTVSKVTPAGAVSIFAGMPGVSGSTDGPGNTARFSAPIGVAVDALGNVYVADYFSCTIRKITPAGVVTTLAGVIGGGSNDGAGATAGFNLPGGLAVDGAGNVYVADSHGYTIRKVTPAGMVSTIAGLAYNSGSADGIGSAARFNRPQGIAVDAMGNILVADTDNQTIRLGCFATAPIITAQPTGQTVIAGQPVTFTVEANGTPVPTYQWRKDGVNIPGATSSSYAITSTVPADAGNYTVVVTNGVGSVTSIGATLNVNFIPVITLEPVSQTVILGGAVMFSAAASGSPLPTYQWRRNGGDIAGATSASYIITNSVSGDAGSYTLVATNTIGTAISTPAILVVNAPPAIMTQPIGHYLTVGANVTMSVVATGTPAPTYQWKKAGVDIPGATSASYLITNAQLADAAVYTVVATNVAGSATSNATTLTVTTASLTPVSNDFTNDGQPDILWRNSATGAFALWRMNGTVAQSAFVIGTAPLDWAVAGTGDFNADGQTDLLWRNPTTGTVAFWLMNGTALQSIVVTANVPTDWTIYGTGDFNNDGKVDILWRNPTSGTVAYWLMNGTAQQSVVVTTNVPTDWTIFGTGDFNNDGRVDILWRKPSTGDVAFWLMNGTALQSVVVTANVPTNWTITGTGDYNNDGQVDILWQNYSTGGVAFWLMNGTAMQSAVVIGNIPADWFICN